MDRVIICSSMEEFINKIGNKVGSYDVVNAIKNKNEKIVLPPNSKLEDVAVEILKTCINDKDRKSTLLNSSHSGEWRVAWCFGSY